MSVYHDVLKRVERLVGLDLVYYIKNSAYMITQNVFSALAALALSVLLARVFPHEVYGQYNFVFSLLGIVSLFSLPGINIALSASVAKGYEGSLLLGAKKKILYSTSGSFLLFLLSLYYLSIGEYLLFLSLIITALIFPFFSTFNIISAYFIGKKRFDRYSFWTTLSAVISSFITVIVGYIFRNLLIVISVYLTSATLVNIYVFLNVMREVKGKKVDKGIVPYGKRLTLITSLGALRFYIDKVVIASFLGFHELAIYSVATAIPNQSKPLWSILSHITFPDLARKSFKDACEAVRKRFVFILLGAVGIILAGVVLLPPVILFFYSSKYAESIFYFQLLMISTIAGPSAVVNTILTSQGKINRLYKAETIINLVGIVLIFVLTYLYGLLGTCIARIIASGFMPLLVRWWVVYR